MHSAALLASVWLSGCVEDARISVFMRLLRQLRFLAKTDSTFARSFISRRLVEWKIRDCCIAWIVAGVNCESLLIITDVRLEQGQCDVLFQPR